MHFSSANYEVCEVTESTDLDSLRGQWLGFLPQVMNRSYVHEFSWSKAVSSDLLPGRVAYYCVYDSGKLIAVVPLERCSRGVGFFSLRWLQLPTDSNIYLNDILVDRAYARSGILDFVLKHVASQSGFSWDYCKLRKFSEQSTLFAELQDTSSLVRKISECDYIPCGERSDLQRISRKMWKNCTRLARKAEREVGEIALSSSELSGQREEFYREFMNIESSGWKGHDGSCTSLAADELAQKFFSALFVNCGEDIRSRVFLLHFGEKAVAGMLAIRVGGTWHILKVGYSEEYKKYGPGSVLLQRFIELMVDDPEVTEINLTTAPYWADRWHFESAAVYEAVCFGPTLLANLSFIYFYAKDKLASIRDRWISPAKGVCD